MQKRTSSKGEVNEDALEQCETEGEVRQQPEDALEQCESTPVKKTVESEYSQITVYRALEEHIKKSTSTKHEAEVEDMI